MIPRRVVVRIVRVAISCCHAAALPRYGPCLIKTNGTDGAEHFGTILRDQRSKKNKRLGRRYGQGYARSSRLKRSRRARRGRCEMQVSMGRGLKKVRYRRLLKR